MNKKITSSILTALMIVGSTSFTSFAAMANGTVVIGSKAFDLAYANDPVHAEEITKEVVAGGVVYVKDFQGNWINNATGLTVASSIIPAVVYKSATKTVNFDAADKDQVTTIAGGSSGSGNTSVVETPARGDEVGTTETDLNSAKTLPAKNYTITSNSATYGPTGGTTTVNGNIAVTNPTGSSLTLRNLNITGTLAINYGAGNVALENVTVNGVNVSNVGSNSLHIKGNTTITTLTVDDANNDAHIVVEGNASVITVVVKSGANIEVDQHAINSQPFVNVTLAPETSTAVITLKGTFQTVLVTKDAKVIMDATSAITNEIKATAPLDFTVPKDVIVSKVNILPSSPTDVFKLSGDLDDVNVSAIATVEIKSGIVKIYSDTNAAVNIVADLDSTVSVPAGSAIDSEKTITGAGSISTIDNVVKAISKDLKNPTIIGPAVGNSIINGNVTIIAGDSYFMTLKNTIINGNLIINGVDGYGGSVTLKNVQVKGPNGNDGTVTVNDVGNNSLHLDGLTASTVDILDNDGARIVAEDKATNNINNIKLSSDSVTVDPTKFEGQFDGTTLNVEKAAKVQVDGYVNNITISNDGDTNSEIKIAQEGNIGTIDVSKSSKVNISGDKCDAASSIGNVTGSVIANDSLQNIKSDSEIYRVAVDDVVTVINKIRSEATELNSLFYRRGRDIQNIIENPQYGFEPGDTYNAYSDKLKIRIANTIRTYMQDNRSFKTKKEIQNAIHSAIDNNVLFAECEKFQGYYESDNPYIFIAPGINAGEDITSIVINHSPLSAGTKFNIVGISDNGLSKDYLDYNNGKIHLINQNHTDNTIYASVDIEVNCNGKISNTNLNIKILPQNTLASAKNGFTNKIVKVKVGETADMTFNVDYPDYSAQPDTATEQVVLNFTFVKNVNGLSDYKVVDKNALSGLEVNYNGVGLGKINLSKVDSADEYTEIIDGIPVTTYSFYVPLSSFSNFTTYTKLKELINPYGEIRIIYPNVPSSIQGLPVSLGIYSNAVNGKSRSKIYSDELYILVDAVDVEKVMANLRDYNAALAAVNQVSYTQASWIDYQKVVAANLVTIMNTQDEVDAATLAIKTGQSSLVTVASTVILTSCINVTSAGDLTLVVKGETLQMSAEVTPTNATDKTVIWKVDTLVDGTALIDISTGYLQATGVGTVTVTATNVASGITGTKVITVGEAPAVDDVTAPVISNGTVENLGTIGGTTATLKYYATQEMGTVKYYYLLQDESENAPGIDAIKASHWGGTTSGNPIYYQINLTNLIANKNYKAYIVMEDATGNTSDILTITGIKPYSNSILTKLGTPSATLTPSNSEIGGLAYTIIPSNATSESDIKEYSLVVASSLSATTPIVTLIVPKDKLSGVVQLANGITAGNSYVVRVQAIVTDANNSYQNSDFSLDTEPATAQK